MGVDRGRLPVAPGDFMGVRTRLERVGIDLRYSGNRRVKENVLGGLDGGKGEGEGRKLKKEKKEKKEGGLCCIE